MCIRDRRLFGRIRLQARARFLHRGDRFLIPPEIAQCPRLERVGLPEIERRRLGLAAPARRGLANLESTLGVATFVEQKRGEQIRGGDIVRIDIEDAHIGTLRGLQIAGERVEVGEPAQIHSLFVRRRVAFKQKLEPCNLILSALARIHGAAALGLDGTRKQARQREHNRRGSLHHSPNSGAMALSAERTLAMCSSSVIPSSSAPRRRWSCGAGWGSYSTSCWWLTT